MWLQKEGQDANIIAFTNEKRIERFKDNVPMAHCSSKERLMPVAKQFGEN